MGRFGVGVVAAVTVAAGLVSGCAPAEAAQITAEEARLDREAPQEILRSSGFDKAATDFARSLGDVHSHAGAERVVERHGTLLWDRAVRRAQGHGPADELGRNDDRPLYWTRLSMTREIRRWRPSFVVTEKERARSGGGGNYLSNEIAYRATLLRDRLGLRLPGGHLHTPVLDFGEGNTDPDTGTITDPTFVQNRQDIIDQVRKIVRVAAGA
jgi:hypothetical protein